MKNSRPLYAGELGPRGIWAHEKGSLRPVGCRRRSKRCPERSVTSAIAYRSEITSVQNDSSDATAAGSMSSKATTTCRHNRRYGA